MAMRRPKMKTLSLLTLISSFTIILCTSLVSENINYRLPTSIVPEEYVIRISLPPKLGNYEFDGTTKIKTRVREETNKIVLHRGKLIVIIKCEITNNQKNIKVDNRTYDEKTEKETLFLNDTLPSNSATDIDIKYSGRFMRNMYGFYMSSYLHNETRKYVAATQFHTIFARQSFPCFDEPQYKAKFTILIERPASFTSLSNMPKIDEKIIEDHNTVSDRFEISPPMSTYLVAFFVSEFKNISDTENKISIWAEPSVVDQGRYALNVASNVSRKFSSLFKSTNSIPKVDMVAAPNMVHIAMENWGLITFKENALLYHANHTSDIDKQKITMTIIHEWGHNYFGNLVTPESWGCTWLSEGFATFFVYFIYISPCLNIKEQFLVQQMHPALIDDGMDTSKPMTDVVTTSEEIKNFGGSITYAKGASIIRMMHYTFGKLVFHEALQNYITLNENKTANPDDLWSSFQNIVDSPPAMKLPTTVKTIMDSWTLQAGLPVVTVTILNGIVKLHQERYFIRNLNAAPTNVTWYIPLTWTDASNINKKISDPYWLTKRDDEVNLTFAKNDWVIFNVNRTGYYRINYDRASWYRIIDTLNSDAYETIPTKDRAVIIDDLLNLARAGLVPYDDAFNALKYIRRETEYLPIKAALDGLKYLHDRFSGQRHGILLNKFILSLITPIYESLGFIDQPGDYQLTILLRAELNKWACNLGHIECKRNSLMYFANWKKNRSDIIPKNQRSIVYCNVVKENSAVNINEVFTTLKNIYTGSISPTERTVALESLSCIENTTILTSILEAAIDLSGNKFIRQQDSLFIFDKIAERSCRHAEFIINFIANHHTKIIEYFGNNKTVNHIISTVSTMLSTPESVKLLEAFIKNNNALLESIWDNIIESRNIAIFELNFYNTYHKTIVKWIKNYNAEIEKIESLKYRLPGDVIPSHYALKLTPHIPENFTFDGNVKINAKIIKNTSKIILHMYQIGLSDVTLNVNGKQVAITKSYEQKFQFLMINTAEVLSAGAELVIIITYTGNLNSIMEGFYRSYYIDKATNAKTWLAASQLEPVGARKMFPCFDEPAMKATFQLNVSRLSDFHTISNTKLKTTIQEGNRFLDVFENTPKMSTYLVALVLSNFKSNGINQNYLSWARPNSISQTEYSSSIITPILNFFRTTLNHKYELPKLDMVALPDFRSGAMENWGLITYKESTMLYDPNYSAITHKQKIAYVVAHEITHQWFGNLVSPHWWKDIWLSEGFARYLQHAAILDLEPDWHSDVEMIVRHLQPSFSIDGLPSSHPLSNDVYEPATIRGMFDTITYAKGASILRMCEKTFGSKLFYAALQDYLNIMQYKNAQPDDLYAAFENSLNSSGAQLEIPVKTFMDTWITQAGFPVVNVNIDREKVTLVQQRFLLHNADDIPIDNTWWIPITWTSNCNRNFSDTKPKYWLHKATDVINIKSVNDSDWIIFNVQQSGYYRVNYDNQSWWRIIELLKSKNYKQIHEVNRAAILDDLFNLARAGYLNYWLPLSAAKYLIQETDYIPWKAAFNNFAHLYRKFANSEVYELYRTYLLTILEPIYNKLGFEEKSSDSHFDKLLRINVVEWACKLNHTECIKNSLNAYNNWKSNSSQLVSVNLRQTIYCTAMKFGTTDDIQVLQKQYEKVNFEIEKDAIINALACSKMDSVIDELLDNAVSNNSGIRYQDSANVFSAIYSSGLYGVKKTLDFLSKKFESFYKYYQDDYSEMNKIFKRLSSYLSNEVLIKKYKEILNIHAENLLSMRDSLETYADDADIELNWSNMHKPKILGYFQMEYDNDFRLPKNINPLKYKIQLIPHLKENSFTFNGSVTITLHIIEDSSNIILHANHLNITDEIIVSVINSTSIVKVDGYTFGLYHKLYIYLNSALKAGSIVTLNIKYTGSLNNQMAGFYRSSYEDDNLNTHWLATTQFQKYGARQAFPCFDEPAFKAKFEISIKRPNDYNSLSNMKLMKSEPSTLNQTWDHYEESKIMSSYLVAFVVSNFKVVKNPTDTFRVWSRPNAIVNADRALEIGQKSLKFLEDYTGIVNPIGKMDFIAIPDFASGAMENWGLTTFKEYGLLSQKNVTSTLRLQNMDTTIAHELAHIWFGNLVTCEWWDYVWLNEGFAQYFRWLVNDVLQPQSRSMEQLVVYELQPALLMDSFDYMRPMNNIMNDLYDDGKDFTVIAYQKSASVIRMIEHAFGEENFHKVLKYYLTQNQYSTTVPSKLWSAFEIQLNRRIPRTNQSVESLMESWTNQAGYPMVRANLTLPNTLSLEQERFLLTAKLNNSQLYWIPITITTKSNPNFTNTTPIIWMGTNKLVIDKMNISENEWYIVNVQQTGFYRVNYDYRNWINLLVAMNDDKFGGIPEIHRAQILDDLFNFARAERLSYHFALNASRYLTKENGHLPWKSFINAISYLHDRFDETPIYKHFKQYLLRLVSPIYREINFIERFNETQLMKINRNLIIWWACKLDHPDCVILARKMFSDYRTNKIKFILPDIKDTIFCTALRYGNIDDWDFMLQQYRASNFESEKIVILNSLGCFPNVTVIHNYLKLIFSGNSLVAVRKQNINEIFLGLSSAGKYGIDNSLEFLINNYKIISQYFNDVGKVAPFISDVAHKLADYGQISKLELFINNTREDLEPIRNSLNQSLATARENMQWYLNNVDKFEIWFMSIEASENVNKPTPDAAVTTQINTYILNIVTVAVIYIILH